MTTETAVFLGAAEPEDFSASASGVSYSGPAEWSYRRMVLHYAHLAELAGGVDAFLIGSELRGLTTLRSATSTYPFVAGLVTLAADVRAIVGGGTAISYAADWSEYFGHQPADGSGDVHFHLDPLWADPEIDFVGIDLYHPLSDWRDEAGHADEASGRSPYNLDYLGGNIRGGEGFDWYYASDARPRRAGAHADRRRRLWQAVGVPLQGHRSVVGERALRPPRRRRIRHADGLDAGGEADPLHRARLPGDRQGRQPAERVLRSEVGGIARALLFERGARRR